MRLTFRLLGPVEVCADGQVLGVTGRPQAVLAMLLLAPNQTVRAERIIQGLWAEAPRTAQGSVHYFVHKLRAVLHQHAPGVVETHGSGYLLRVDPAQIDTVRVERLVEAARTACDGGDLQAAWARYGDALGLWAGPALMDLGGYPFAGSWVARFDALQLACVTERMQVGMGLGWHAELVGELEALVVEHPDREGLRRLLMVALYRSGRQAEALDAYTSARRHTVETLGVEPGEELRRVQHAILTQDPSLTPPPTTAKRAVPPRAPSQPTPAATKSVGGSASPAASAPRRAAAGQPPFSSSVGSRAERRLVSVLAVELQPPEVVASDPTPPSEGLLEAARGMIARYGGVVHEALGGRLVVVFGRSRVREDDPERAVRAALEICTLARQGSPVRAGVDTGEVLVEPTRILGAALLTAAALCAQAPAGGVLVGLVAYHATSRAITYHPHPSEQPTTGAHPPAWRAVEPRARIGLALPGGRSARLVERHRERDLLGYALARIRDPDTASPQLVTLLGAPGVGKTRLVEELGRLVDAAPELICWRQGRCTPYSGHGQLAVGALAQIVMAEVGITPDDSAETAQARLDAAAAALIGDPTDASLVADGLRVLLGPQPDTGRRSGPPDAGAVWGAWVRFVEAMAAQRPTVLVVEDLHWADEALLDVVAGLVGRVGPVPLLLVVTARPELRTTRPGWGGGQPNATTIALEPLTGPGSRLLLDRLLTQAGVDLPEDRRTRVLAKAGGNPLFLEEYVRVLDQPAAQPSAQGDMGIPATVHQVIAARLDALPDAEQELLAGIAILGDPVGGPALGAVCGQDATEVAAGLEHLERRDLLRRTRTSRPDHPVYVLRHALIGEVAYGRLLRAQRADGHERAARWLQTRPAEEPGRLEALAHHYQQALTLTRAAGQPTGELAPRARAAARAAGDRALRLGALGTAARWYKQALKEWPVEDPARAGLLLALGRVLAYGQQTGQEVLSQARAACQAAGDPAGVAEAEALLSHLARVGMHPDTAVAHTDRALALPVASTPAEVEALTSKAISALMADQHPQAIRIAGQAQRLARQLGLPGQVANAASIATNSRILAGDLDAVADAERARDDMDRLGAPIAVYAYFGVAHALWWYGALDRCGHAVTLGHQAARTADAVAGIWIAAVEAGLAYSSGQWLEAEALTGRVLGDDRAVYLHPWAQVLRGRMRLGRGELTAAHVCAQAALAHTTHPTTSGTGDVRYWQTAAALAGRVALARGDQQHAAALARGLLNWLQAEPARGCVTPDLAWLLTDLDPPPGRLPEGLAPTRWHQAVSAVVEGDLPAALAPYTAVGSAVDEAAVRLRLAQQLAAEGHQAAAADHADQAAVVWRKAGATAALGQAEALLTTRPRQPPPGPANGRIHPSQGGRNDPARVARRRI